MISDTAARDAYQHRLGWRINTHLRHQQRVRDGARSANARTLASLVEMPPQMIDASCGTRSARLARMVRDGSFNRPFTDELDREAALRAFALCAPSEADHA